MTPTTPRGARVSHIGIAVRALGESAPFFRDVLGLAAVELDDADGARIAGFSAGEPLVELLEAVDPDSPSARFVEKRGAGDHHTSFSVNDHDRRIGRYRQTGIQRIDEVPRIRDEGKPLRFFNLKA